jgi:hypothetical protein
MKKPAVQPIAFGLVVVAYLFYSAFFIHRTSLAIDGQRVFCLFDDEMISMRYAHNLARGRGLVWNPGDERVEGYTNPLWTLWMAALHLLPVSDAKMSLLVQVSGAVLIVATLAVVARLARAVAADQPAAWLGAVFLTAFYLPLSNWALQGTEVSALALLTTLAAWQSLSLLAGEGTLPGLYVLLGVGTLVRPDFVVTLFVVWVFLVVADRRRRRAHLVTGLAVVVAFLGGQTLFRLLYYGDPLPNTYYLKLTGFPLHFRLVRGLFTAQDFIWDLNWVLFLFPFAFAAWRGERHLGLLASLVLAQLLYSVYVGGDAWEWWGGANRYVAPAMPCFFVLFAAGLAYVADTAASAAARKPPPLLLTPRALRVGLGVFLLLSWLNFNALKGPRGLLSLALIRLPLEVERNRGPVEEAFLLRSFTTPEARVAASRVGALAYFSDRPIIDILGKNDRWVARRRSRLLPGASPWVGFLPGHTKWEAAYSIGKLRPDVVVQLWDPYREAVPYLQRWYVEAQIRGHRFYFLRGSPRICWDKVRTWQGMSSCLRREKCS